MGRSFTASANGENGRFRQLRKGPPETPLPEIDLCGSGAGPGRTARYELLFLQGANVSDDPFYVVRGQALDSSRVLGFLGNRLGEVGIRHLLGFIRNQAR